MEGTKIGKLSQHFFRSYCENRGINAEMF